MKFILRQKFLLISSIILIGNCLFGYTIYNSKQRLSQSENWIEHTEQVIDKSEYIYLVGKDIKTNSRDYIISGDTSFIQQMHIEANSAFAGIQELKRLTRDNPSQQPRIDSLNLYMHKRVAFALKTIEVRKTYGLTRAITYTATQNNNYYSVPIGGYINAIKQAEEVLLKQRKIANVQSLESFNKLSILMFLLMTAFTIVLIITVGNYLHQNREKEKRAAELIIANAELYFQNREKEKRAGELIIANKELFYQSGEKKKRAGELIIAKKELTYQSGEKEKRAAELIIADEELLYQSDEKEKRAAELVIANKELVFQNAEKGKRAAELVIANVELLFQNNEKGKRADELAIANKELLYQSDEKEKRAAELALANIELLYQNDEKEKRADELIIANEELWYQNNEKEKRAAELVIANKELSYQNKEREQRAVELAFVNEELVFQNDVRKLAERNLYKSESRLKEAQAIAHTGNFDINLIEYSDEWSDGLYNIFGLKRKDVTPSTELFLSMIHVDDLDYVTQQVKKAYKNFKSFTIDFRFMHENGTIRYGYLEAKFKLDKDNTPMRLFGIIQDVTDMKIAETERIQMVNDLMTRNNDLEQFAYIVSHNLRAPVANIIGASNALNEVDITDADKLILKKAINTSILKLDDVVQDLNQILQVKSNINETSEMVHFSALVDDIKISITNLIRQDVDIRYDFTDMNQLLTIKPYIYSIFYNLISNSVKYCQPDTACSIEITSRIEKNTLKLIFTDNGLGINLDKKGEEVFGLYKRFHPHIEGKGMGLYMVKTQVETLGGKISIKSEENVGTEFTIEFALSA